MLMWIFHSFIIYCGAILLQPTDGGESNPINDVLYNALQEALITNDNLFRLQYLFYPPTTVPESSVQFVICKEDFTVKRIDDGKDNMEGAFVYDGECDCYTRSIRDFSCFNTYSVCPSIYDLIEISDPDNTQFLGRYLKTFFLFLRSLDITFFRLLFAFIDDPNLKVALHDEYNYGQTTTLTLSIQHLQIMPREQELITNLEAVLTWVKYHVRNNNTLVPSPRLESDRSLVNMLCNNYTTSFGHTYTITETLHSALQISITTFLNVAVMFVGLYIISQALSFSATSNPSFFEPFIASQVNSRNLFWSSSVVITIVNVGCFITEITDISIVSDDGPVYATYHAPMTLVLMLIEFCVIFVVTKKEIISDHILCISQRLLIKIVQTFAICNLLWFAHRIANCFVISIYFVAIAPPQTIAVITLCLSTILLSVIALVCAAYYCCSGNTQNKCKTCYKTFMVILIFVSVIIVLLSFTLIFIDLTQHGLSGSDMGSIILSLAVPSVLFVAGLVAKRQMKKSAQINEPETSEYTPIQGENVPKHQEATH